MRTESQSVTLPSDMLRMGPLFYGCTFVPHLGPFHSSFLFHFFSETFLGFVASCRSEMSVWYLLRKVCHEPFPELGGPNAFCVTSWVEIKGKLKFRDGNGTEWEKKANVRIMFYHRAILLRARLARTIMVGRWFFRLNFTCSMQIRIWLLFFSRMARG